MKMIKTIIEFVIAFCILGLSVTFIVACFLVSSVIESYLITKTAMNGRCCRTTQKKSIKSKKKHKK